jgi:hypothetical protein
LAMINSPSGELSNPKLLPRGLYHICRARSNLKSAWLNQ